MASASTTPSLRVSPLPAERFFQGSLLLLIASSIATLIATGKLDPVACVLATIAMAYRCVRWWRHQQPELSHRMATLLVVSYLAVFPLDVFLFSRAYVANSSNPALYAALLGAIHFLLFVMLVRLYSATTDRDAFFLAILAFSAILAAAILTVDTFFLIMFFVFLLFGVATFVGLEMRRGGRGAAVQAIVHPLQERRLARALTLAAASVALGAILIGGTLFFFFPRFSAGYLGHTGMQPSLMSGFNDDVELGQIGEIKKNPAVVMRVKTGSPVGYARLRWRGIALTTFDGKRWSTPNHRQPSALTPNVTGWIDVSDPEQNLSGPSIELHYEALVQPMATDAIFVPSNAVSVLGGFSGENPNPGISTRRTYVFRDFTGSLFNPFRNYAPVRYYGVSRLPSIQPAKLRAASTVYPDNLRSLYLQVPTLDKRIPALAQSVTARAANPYDKAIALENYLRTRYTYTLELTGKPGQDPLAHFLFETRAGHCEYFASAMTIMLRTIGIPSREVNGFLPGEYNDLAGDYIVRASDAHSWVEAYFPGSGWITFDPTPASNEQYGFLSRLGQYVDWMELSWNEWVINYDFAHQVQVAQLMQRSTRNWSESIHSWFAAQEARGKQKLKSWLDRRGDITFALPVALALLLVLLRYDLLGIVARRVRFYLQVRAPGTKAANPQLASKLYAELLRALAKRGFARKESQTPLEFAFTVGEPNLAPAVREFTEIYAKARFGGMACDTSRLRGLLEQIRAVRTQRS
jgi:transglutaminase-like putative cysteine protease